MNKILLLETLALLLEKVPSERAFEFTKQFARTSRRIIARPNEPTESTIQECEQLFDNFDTNEFLKLLENL